MLRLGARRRLGAARRRRRLAARAARRCAARSAWSLLWTAWLALANAKADRHQLHPLGASASSGRPTSRAYFGGRAFGKRKLAPAISPGKSWEGVWSGMVGALVLAAVLARDRPHVAGRLARASTRMLRNRFGVVGAGRWSLVFLVAMSVVGDLFESLVKRSAGAKDSSRLLPGHGGVLDRIDALLPVFPIALALASL